MAMVTGNLGIWESFGIWEFEIKLTEFGIGVAPGIYIAIAQAAMGGQISFIHWNSSAGAPITSGKGKFPRWQQLGIRQANARIGEFLEEYCRETSGRETSGQISPILRVFSEIDRCVELEKRFKISLKVEV